MGNDLYMLLDMLITAAGVYVVIQYIMMVKTRKIQQNMLLPKDVDAKKCKDAEGYINYIGLKQLLFGLAAILCGVLSLIQDVTGSVNAVISAGGTIVFLASAAWYAYGMRKAMTEYWGRK